MKRGRQTCRILKEIRRQIAEANDIVYVTSECRYQGECRGTCPKCEAEVRWLEEQLRHRSATGKLIRVAGISAGILALSGCSESKTPPSTQPVPTDTTPEITADTISAPLQRDSTENCEKDPRLDLIALPEDIMGEPWPEEIPDPPESGEILLPDTIVESEIKSQVENSDKIETAGL